MRRTNVEFAILLATVALYFAVSHAAGARLAVVGLGPIALWDIASAQQVRWSYRGFFLMMVSTSLVLSFTLIDVTAGLSALMVAEAFRKAPPQ